MKHARADYDRIQDPAGLIPEEEPVFLLRGQDINAPATVKLWAHLAEISGADESICRAAMRQAEEMEQWQRSCSVKVPDMPEDA